MSLTQPTASRRIRRLEADLGQDLLSREGRSVTPTRSGLMLLQFAQRILPEERALREQLGESCTLQGALHIAASTAPGESFVPGLLAAFADRHPGLQAQLYVMDSQAVERCVAEGTCDVGFTGQSPGPGLLASLVIGHDELVLAVPRSHPAFERTEIQPEELLREAFVERAAGSGTRRTVEEQMAKAGVQFSLRRIALTVNSAQAVLAAVRSGMGVGFVSRLALRSAPKGEIRGLRVAGIPIERPLYLLWDERRGEAAAAFVEFARQERLGRVK